MTQRIRFSVQTLFFLITAWALYSFWGPGGAHHICPFTVIQTPLLAIKRGIPPNFFLIGVGIGAFFILVGMILPRVFCGWVCPIGFISRIFGWIGKKLGIRNSIGVKTNNAMGWLAIAVLIYVIVATLLTGQLYCRGGCPLYWSRAMWRMTMPVISIVLISIFIFGSIVVERFFCRWLCPYGAILGLLARFSLLSIRKEKDSCVGCPLCSDCPMGTLPQDGETVRGPMCISCLRCTTLCKRGSLTLGFRRAKTKGNNNGQ